MKKVFFTLLTILSVTLVSCEEEIVYLQPTAAPASNDNSVLFGAKDQKAVFNVSKDPALTATYNATGVGVTIKNPTGTVTGNTVEIMFDAGTKAGAGSITLDVTDSKGVKSTGTFVMTIQEEIKVITVSQTISTNTTWETGKTYILAGRITVTSGATLTIQPGVVVKGQAGTGANATALLIARGGKLNALGTAALPIIFTSVADNITPEDIAAGKYVSPNLEPTVNGLWGGILILGKARISASNATGDRSEVQIEGIPTSDPNGLYGGNDDNDNSGTIKYISIRHGGANIGNGNEINGLTLGGVGNGTVIENVEVVANQDDGIEFFGGSVNVKNAVVWNSGDDSIDTDQSWSGTLDNFAIINGDDHSFELDGPEGSYAAGHTIKNGFVVAGGGDLINTDANSEVILENIYIKGITTQKINRVTAAKVVFNNIFLDVLPANLSKHLPAGATAPAGVKAGNTNTFKASELSWTWASKANKLN